MTVACHRVCRLQMIAHRDGFKARERLLRKSTAAARDPADTEQLRQWEVGEAQELYRCGRRSSIQRGEHCASLPCCIIICLLHLRAADTPYLRLLVYSTVQYSVRASHHEAWAAGHFRMTSCVGTAWEAEAGAAEVESAAATEEGPLPSEELLYSSFSGLWFA